MAGVTTADAKLGRDAPRRLWRSAGIVFAFLLIVANSAYSLVMLRGLQRADGSIQHTQQVLLGLENLLSLARDAQAGQRAYLVSGNEQFLGRFRDSAQRVAPALAALRGLTADDPDQQRRLGAVDQLIGDNLKTLDEGIARRGAGGAAIDPAELVAGLDRLDRIRAAIGDMQSEQERLYRERSALAEDRAIAAQVILAVATAGSLLLLWLIFRFMGAEAQRREEYIESRRVEASSANELLRTEVATRKQAEEEIERTRVFLDLVIEHVPGMLFVKDAQEHRFVLFNRAGEELLGFKRNELIGKTDYDLFPKEQADRFVERDRAVLTSGALQVIPDESISTRHKGLRSFATKMMPVAGEHGRPHYLLGFSEDITERKRFEEQLRQAQKLDAVAQLTGGVAHDFNNLLAIVIGNADLLLEAVKDHPQQSDLVNAILNGALRGAELTHRLLAFARRQPLQPQVFDLNERVPDMVAMLRRTLGETIQIAVKLGEGLWSTRADPSKVEDALVSLAINARDAMPEGGKLTVETANVHLDASHGAEAGSGDFVVLSLTDTGAGMAPEIVAQATEPFFSTKETGAGTGLGLSMIHGFVRQSGGHMKILSEVGYGTTVALYLPRVESESAAPRVERPLFAAMPRGHESILLVEDNPNVRKTAAWLLLDLGYKVREAPSGPAAMSILAGAEEFDLLFTDIVMPEGMSGYQLAEAARALRPGMKVLYTTGYSKLEPTEEDDELANTQNMIRKPYRKQELAQKVRAALELGS